jgi:hypothetical protein
MDYSWPIKLAALGVHQSILCNGIEDANLFYVDGKFLHLKVALDP